MCDNFVLNLRLQGLIHQKSLFQALYMTETDKEREDGVLGMSFFSEREKWDKTGRTGYHTPKEIRKGAWSFLL